MLHISMIVKLLASMIGVLFFLRISGKTQLSQLTPLDTVNAFAIGAFVGGSIYDNEISAWFVVYAIAIWTAINIIVRFFSKYQFINKIIYGSSEYLLRNGLLDLKNMQKNHIGIEQLRGQLREKGIYSLFDVDAVRIEADGEISVYPHKNVPKSYLLINDGHISADALKDASKDETWLNAQIQHFLINKIEDIYALEWTPGRGFYIVTEAGKSEFHPDK